MGLKEALKSREKRKEAFKGLDDFFLDQQSRIKDELTAREEKYQQRLRYHGVDRKSRLSLTLITPDQDEGGVWQNLGHANGKKKPTGWPKEEQNG